MKGLVTRTCTYADVTNGCERDSPTYLTPSGEEIRKNKKWKKDIDVGRRSRTVTRQQREEEEAMHHKICNMAKRHKRVTVISDDEQSRRVQHEKRSAQEEVAPKKCENLDGDTNPPLGNKAEDAYQQPGLETESE